MKLSLLMATVLMRQQPLQRTLVTIQRTFDDFATQQLLLQQSITTGFSFDLDENITQNLLKKFK
jgi:hypothetical protein